MRVGFLLAFAALALTACGKPKQPETDATPAPPALPATAGLSLEGRLVATGTEPFWRLEIATEGLTFSSPDGPDIKAPYAALSPDEAGASLASGRFKLRLSVQPCSDGMSETAYPMGASVELQGVGVFSGCAYARWDNALTQMIPAIDACLGATTEPSPIVYAVRDADSTMVRLSGLEVGERYDCRVDAAGNASILGTDAPPAPGEGDPTFLRAPADAPARTCKAVEVKGPDGALIGWEMRPGAC